MLKPRHLIVVAAGSAACLLGYGTIGLADGIGQVSCSERPQAGCEVKAGSQGESSANTPSQNEGPVQGDQSGPTGSNAEGTSSNVEDEDCDQVPPPGGAPVTSQEAECRVFGGPENTGPAQAAGPSPEALGRQAVSRLDIPVPMIGSSPGPGARHLVGLPTWLWVDSSTWQEQTASASVPGLTVTARARPVRVVWSMGDGSTVDCRSSGTLWRVGMDPRAASPDCGYTYKTSSASKPGGAFTVTATMTWSVSWSGGDAGGELDPLSTQASTTLRVGEAQELNSAGAARERR